MASNASVASSDDSSVSYRTATSGPLQNASPQHRRNLSGESLGGFSELDTPPRDFMSRCAASAFLTSWVCRRLSLIMEQTLNTLCNHTWTNLRNLLGNPCWLKHPWPGRLSLSSKLWALSDLKPSEEVLF